MFRSNPDESPLLSQRRFESPSNTAQVNKKPSFRAFLDLPSQVFERLKLP